MSETPVPSDDRLHISEADFAFSLEQFMRTPLRFTDGAGLRVFVRFNPEKARTIFFDAIAQLTSDDGGGAPHYDLVIGDAP